MVAVPKARHIPTPTSVYHYDYERAVIEAKRAMRRLSKLSDHVSHVGPRPAAERGIAGCGLYDDEHCSNPSCDKAMDAAKALQAFLDAKPPETYGEGR